MWKQIEFAAAVRHGNRRMLLRTYLAFIDRANAYGQVLQFDDETRLGAVSRYDGKPYDVDNNPVDGETEPTVAAMPPEFFLWEK